jgi:hypothetical protein
MNKEQQELLDGVYQNYVKWWEKSDDSCNLTEEQSNKWLKLIDGGLQWAPFSQESFINKCKTDTEFSEKWGLKIEERELSAKERWDWYRKNGGPSGEQKLVALMVYEDEEDNSHIHSWLKTWAPNVPTKLITITYNDKTIESYES